MTGATSAVAETALQWCRSHFTPENIIALGRNPERLASVAARHGASTGILDLAADQGELRERLSDLELPSIDTVFHFAAAIPDEISDPRDFYRVNFINSRFLFDSLPFAADVAILNLSTASVYEPRTKHIVETSPRTYFDDYGISKYLFEKYLESKVSDSSEKKNDTGREFRALSVRVPVLLTPGIGHNFISKWRSSIVNSRSVTIFNGDGLFNSCVWAEDIFDFFSEFRSNEKTLNLTCNVGAEKSISIAQALKVLADGLGRRAKVVNVPSNRPSQYYDCTLAKRHGYRPGSVESSLEKFSKT